MKFVYQFVIFALIATVKSELVNEVVPVTTPTTVNPTPAAAFSVTTSSTGFHCVGVGFYAIDNSCDKFYYCMRVNGEYVPYELECPPGQNYMAGLNYCSATYECSEQ